MKTLNAVPALWSSRSQFLINSQYNSINKIPEDALNYPTLRLSHYVCVVDCSNSDLYWATADCISSFVFFEKSCSKDVLPSDNFFSSFRVAARYTCNTSTTAQRMWCNGFMLRVCSTSHFAIILSWKAFSSVSICSPASDPPFSSITARKTRKLPFLSAGLKICQRDKVSFIFFNYRY